MCRFISPELKDGLHLIIKTYASHTLDSPALGASSKVAPISACHPSILLAGETQMSCSTPKVPFLVGEIANEVHASKAVSFVTR